MEAPERRQRFPQRAAQVAQADREHPWCITDPTPTKVKWGYCLSARTPGGERAVVQHVSGYGCVRTLRERLHVLPALAPFAEHGPTHPPPN